MLGLLLSMTVCQPTGMMTAISVLDPDSNSRSGLYVFERGVPL